jgi:hypothetical protein
MSDPFGTASYAPTPSVAPTPSAQPASPAPESDSDGFDRDRVLRLLDRLERDVTAVEAAMEHAESGDQEAFAAAVAPLESPLAD